MLAKAKPGAVNFASTGVASVGHLTGELLNTLAGMKMTHVPYKGGGAAIIGLLSGEVQVMFTGFSAAMPHLKSGKIKGLAVTGAKRSPGAHADRQTDSTDGFAGITPRSAERRSPRRRPSRSPRRPPRLPCRERSSSSAPTPAPCRWPWSAPTGHERAGRFRPEPSDQEPKRFAAVAMVDA